MVFNKQITKTHQDHSFTFQKIEVADSIILNILIDGIGDSTFELPLNSQQSINILSNISNHDAGIEPRIIVGDHKNLKLQIIASQIGKLFFQVLEEPKNVTLTIASRWFGRGDETSDEDFEKLMFVLESVKELISGN